MAVNVRPIMKHAWGVGLDLSRQLKERDAAQAVEPARVVIHVCETCRGTADGTDLPRDGSRLAEATRDLAAAGIEVRGVSCLANCKRGLSAAILNSDGWSYVFGDLTTESAEDLLTGARLLAGSTDGLMPWKGRPDSLKRGMIARVPPLDSTPHQKP